jgi:hypothetical protein
MPTAELVAVWSIRASGVLFAAASLAALYAHASRGVAVLRVLWTAGCLMLLAHELAALGGYFHWSQTAAWEHIANRSRQFAGLGWGGGLMINYAAALLWSGDVAWWWIAPASRARRGAWISITLWSFLAALFFFGAVAFVAGPTRYVAAAQFVMVGIAYALRLVARSRPSAVTSP